MKLRYITILTTAILAAQVVAQEPQKLTTQKDKLSYTIGQNTGEFLNKNNIEINQDLLIKGILDGLSGNQSLLSEQELKETLLVFQKEMMAKQTEARKKMAEAREKMAAAQGKLAEENLKNGEAFLAENAKKEGVISLPSGLQYKVITPGTGKTPKVTDEVTTHYRGTLIDGTEFDSSYKRGESTKFTVGKVVAGWQEALQLMKEGAKWQLFIPAKLAYKDKAPGGKIGPNATLIFELELISVSDSTEQEMVSEKSQPDKKSVGSASQKVEKVEKPSEPQHAE
jgi:FKBP-type peptidyl-prolyl cis-trans isomerase